MSLIAGVRARPWLALVPCLLIITAVAYAGPASPPARARNLHTALTGGNWIATWGASPQAPTSTVPLSMHGFKDATLREIVFSSAAGTAVTVRLTNTFGAAPLLIGRASIALAGPGSALVPGTVQRLTFEGQPSVMIPAGSEVTSDPVSLNVPALSRLAVSLYIPGPTGPATFHSQSHDVNYLAPGSHVLDENTGPFGRELSSWFFIDSIDTYSPARYEGAVVALGDSITAGVGSQPDADANWPDDLARRLEASPGDTLSVVDEGIGGNRVLNGSECCGLSAIDRFAPDVLSQAGVRDVILLEGVNDLGFSQQHTPTSLPHTNVTAAQLIAGDERIIAAAHAAGLRIFGATVLPFQGARYWTPAAEIKREILNHWILTSGAFDGVLDFSSLMADPANPLRLNPAYDSGDHLHPNDAGYHAMADAIPLDLLLGSTAAGAAHRG